MLSDTTVSRPEKLAGVCHLLRHATAFLHSLECDAIDLWCGGMAIVVCRDGAERFRCCHSLAVRCSLIVRSSFDHFLDGAVDTIAPTCFVLCSSFVVVDAAKQSRATNDVFHILPTMSFKR